MRLSLWIFLSWNRSEKWEERGEKAKTGGDIQRELAIIPATCLPSILKDTDMSLLNVPACKELPEDIYVVIEIPANADPIKYEIDKDTGHIPEVQRGLTQHSDYLAPVTWSHTLAFDCTRPHCQPNSPAPTASEIHSCAIGRSHWSQTPPESTTLQSVSHWHFNPVESAACSRHVLECRT